MSKRGNGEGSVFYNNTLKKWVGQYTAYGKRKTIYGNRQKDVVEKLNLKLAEIQENTYISENKITLSEITSNYINQLYNSNNIKATSYIRKMATYNVIKKFDFANEPIQKLNIDKINSELPTISYKYSESSIKKVCGLISTSFDRAVALNIIKTNPFKVTGAIIRPKSKKITKKVDAFTLEEQKKFESELAKGYDEYTEIFYILLYTRYESWRSFGSKWE